MPWLFGRGKKASAKLKTKQAALTGHPGHPNHPEPPEPLQRATSKRSARRRRASSRSTSSSLRHATVAQPAQPASSAEDITALPIQRNLQHSPHLRPVTQDHTGISYNFYHHHSHSSLPPTNTQPTNATTARDRRKLQRPQSLRRDPHPESSLVRRKSSKRRKEHDHVREEEIRAMTFPMPQKRPAGHSGGMLRRESKKVKGSLNHRLERPTSNVSLPLPDSIHSSMSGNSESRAFRVSALDMFSPRPTIRFSVGSQHYLERSSPPNTVSERQEPRRERRPISSSHRDEKRNKRTSRIDDLADTLDAGALREILERDKKRREKKAKADHERLRRRLERRAEHQNASEAAAAAVVGGTPATPRKEATGMVGLGIEQGASPMEDVRPSTPQRPWVETLPVTPKAQEISQLPTPLDSPVEEPVVSDARAIRYSRGSISGPSQHTRGQSNVSELPELLSETLAQTAPVQSVEVSQDPNRSGSLHPVVSSDTNLGSKKGSISKRRRSSEGRRMSVFASFFRRGKRNSQDQGRVTPSEVSFSNTSRESMSRQPLPAHLVAAAPAPVAATAPIQIKRPSSVPRRTMSKFREDLPEFPLSPPDSRVQSPEVPSTSAIAARRRSQQALSDLRAQSATSRDGTRSDSPVSPGAPTGNFMSQSLASVDSEGSWLSGKPIKRASNMSQLRSSVTSSSLQPNAEYNNSYEELGMADDEYFRRLTPQPDERRRSTHSNDILGRKASSSLMALEAAAESEEETETTPGRKISSDSEELVKSGVARQPTIVHRQPRVKSTEGLLSMYLEDRSAQESTPSKNLDTEPTTPETPVSDQEPATMVQRAKSVDLGKNHARHLSAGSAKLLDIQKRSSSASHGKAPEHE